MIVFLDRQHTGKPLDSRGSHKDMGAVADLDANGSIDMLDREANLTLVYGHLHAADRLRALGHLPMPISDGRYSERHKRVTEYARGQGVVVYAAMHLNSFVKPDADYGFVAYDHQSPASMGRELARCIATALQRRAPELARVKVEPCSPTAWENAYSTIRGTGRGVVSVCYEPCFLSTLAHRQLLTAEGLQRLGYALAEGVDAFARQIESPPVT